jgi:hypothetical protein
MVGRRGRSSGLSTSTKVNIHGDSPTSFKLREIGNRCKYEAQFMELCGLALCLVGEEGGGTSTE